MACRLVGSKPVSGTNAGILLSSHLGTDFSEIVIEIYIFSVKKMHLGSPCEIETSQSP